MSGSGILFLIALVGVALYKSDDAMGMGDVKIFVPYLGLFLGWRMVLLALGVAIVLGGVTGLILILTGIKKRKEGIPFGPNIVLAVFITIMWGWVFKLVLKLSTIKFLWQIALPTTQYQSFIQVATWGIL